MGKDELIEGLDGAFDAAIAKTIREASNATLAGVVVVAEMYERAGVPITRAVLLDYARKSATTKGAVEDFDATLTKMRAAALSGVKS